MGWSEAGIASSPGSGTYMGHCLPHMSSGACCDACQPCRRQYPVCLSIETVEHQKLAFVPYGPSHIGSSFLCLSPASRHCLPPRPTVSHCCAGSRATLQQGPPHYRLKHSLQRPGSLRLPSYRQKTSLMSAITLPVPCEQCLHLHCCCQLQAAGHL